MSVFDQKMEELIQRFDQRMGFPQELFDATEEELKQLQDAIAYTLPPDYLEFIRKYAGAYIDATFPLVAGGEGCIGCFLRLELGDPFALPEQYSLRSDFTPSYLLPLGGCERGYIYLSLREQEYGFVYFLSEGLESDELDFTSQLRLASYSLREFIESLR